MIVSASRRTDIPAFYSSWLLRRLREGHVLVPYPRNPKRQGSVRLSPDNVDCLIFWTKNPAPMLPELGALHSLGYRYYFSFTITPYGADLERNLPPKERVLESFLRLSEFLGPKRVDWRFDPILLSDRHPLTWLLDRFGYLCGRLQGATERCIINFIKSYAYLGKRFSEPDAATIERSALGLARVAAEYGLPLYHCTGKWDLRHAGILPASCIDRKKIEELTGWPLKGKKDPGQPAYCSCLESVDIGLYDSCGNGCVYCYATTGEDRTRRRMAAHDPASPVLIGQADETLITTDRTGPSLRNLQVRLL